MTESEHKKAVKQFAEISEEELQEREERNLKRFKKKVNRYVSENDS